MHIWLITLLYYTENNKYENTKSKMQTVETDARI